MTTDEILFFNKYPQMLFIYQIIADHLQSEYPDVCVKVCKTQISFQNPRIFAMVSLPWRKIKNRPSEYLLLSFGLNYQKESPRIETSVEAYHNRWTHHVILECEEDIDEEILSWLAEAYRFAKSKLTVRLSEKP